MIKYAIENLLAMDGVELSSSSQDPPYVRGKVFNSRPSYPFRFDGIGVAPGDVPEWLCADLGSEERPNFTAIFNHNMTTLLNSTDLFYFQACILGCPPTSGFCDWDLYDLSGGAEFNLDLSGRIRSDHKNVCSGEFDMGSDYRYYRWSVIDSLNTENFIEWGEVFLGEIKEFVYGKLQPGRSDGPEFHEGTNITSYGQIWPNYLSESDSFQIEIVNHNDINQISELRTFVKEVKRNDGKFVFIPDDQVNLCYYVYMRNLQDFNQQIVRGMEKELYSWKMDLITLTEGIRLIG